MSAPNRGLPEFISEASEIVDALARELGDYEEEGVEVVSLKRVNALFRGAHSLKGLAGMFGQEVLADLADQLEEVLDRLRMGKQRMSPAALTALVQAVDVMRALLGELSEEVGQTRTETANRAHQARTLLKSLTDGGEVEPRVDWAALPLPESTQRVLSEYEQHRIAENLRLEHSFYFVRLEASLSDFDTHLTSLSAQLNAKGELISTLPAERPGAAESIAFDLLFAADSSLEELQAWVSSHGAQARPILRSTHSPEAGEAGIRESEGALRSLSQTVRVDIGKLDSLMNSVGELLLAKRNLQKLNEEAAAYLPKALAGSLARQTRVLERRLDELQEGILDVRMVPLGQVFDKLARLVRRLARAASKQIDFITTGVDVELDKLIVDELSDPLMHLLRNAIDHGIDTSEVRERAGKPGRATLALRASQKGNHVIIEVTDDGRGIDEARVREVAVQKGLVTAQQAGEMSRRDVQNLIFLPGFSTMRGRSELSGRGVGLDVVKTNISNLSGIIDVRSESGQGTTFHLTLPVTLAIVRALVVMVSARVYAIPLNAVVEIVSISSEDIRTIERKEVISLRDQTLPLTRLSSLFRLPPRVVARPFVVVVGIAHQRVGLMVDELTGQQDIVVKTLGGRLRHTPGISGATDLGDNRAVLVLDVGALVEEVLSPDRRADFL